MQGFAESMTFDRTILVVGVGAIGGPLVLALTADCTATIRFCDDDVVEHANLHRQVQFASPDIGKDKVLLLSCRLQRKGIPANAFDARRLRFDSGSADSLLDGVDVVIDGSDNFATKFAVNDAAVGRGIPALIASAVGNRGQLFIAQPGRACYRCLFEDVPTNEPGNCTQVGVLGPLPAIMAGHAAVAAQQLLAGYEHLLKPLTIVDRTTGWNGKRTVDFKPRVSCPSCSRAPHFVAARSPTKDNSTTNNQSNFSGRPDQQNTKEHNHGNGKNSDPTA